MNALRVWWSKCEFLEVAILDVDGTSSARRRVHEGVDIDYDVTWS